MKRRSEELVVYRQKPDDISYKTGTEFAYCDWCVHNYLPRSCDFPWDPDPQNTDRRFSRVKRNPDGLCVQYRPTRWVRFWRIFGFYKPVPIPKEISSP